MKLSKSDARPCRVCGERIVMGKAWNGKFLPFNADHDPEGNHTFTEVSDNGGAFLAQYIRTEDRSLHTGLLFSQHQCAERKALVYRLAVLVKELVPNVPPELAAEIDRVIAIADKHSGKVACQS